MKKYFSAICTLLLLLNILSACSNEPKKLTGEEIYTKISPSTVEVYAESDFVSSLGTGFYIDDSGTVVTNYHVIQDCSNAYVTTNDGGTYEVKNVLGYSEELDIALLETTKSNSTAVETCTSVTTGETVYVLGSSLGLTGTFSEGLVSTAERTVSDVPYIQISAPISHGNSGGPVVNAMGQVIGIASAGFEEGQNLNLALPIIILDRISTEHPISVREFYETTSEYVHLGDRVVAHGSTLAVRTITLDSFMAEFVLSLWELGEATENTMIEIMDEYGTDQGGGQLYIIDPGTFVKEIDDWCFDPTRQPGDYAIIENPYGYSICYISMLNNATE